MAFCNLNCSCGNSCSRQDDHGGACDCKLAACSGEPLPGKNPHIEVLPPHEWARKLSDKELMERMIIFMGTAALPYAVAAEVKRRYNARKHGKRISPCP